MSKIRTVTPLRCALVSAVTLCVASCALLDEKADTAKSTKPTIGQAQGRPNFIVIFTDDQGYADLGCFGSKNIKTPHIDRMAKEGCRFTSFMVGSSVCTPSRAALLTGSYPKRVGNPVPLAANGEGLIGGRISGPGQDSRGRSGS